MGSVPILPLLSALLLSALCASLAAQDPQNPAPAASLPQSPAIQQSGPQQSGPQQSGSKPLRTRSTLDPHTQLTPEQQEALRNGKLAIVNGRPYEQPTKKIIFDDYVTDSYGLPAVLRTTVRALYSEARDAPSGWGTDFPGFMQRFGANAGQTIISGNVRYAMELTFHEDLRYIACHGCSVKGKIQNALLAEITARHDTDGHRFFTLTPTIADFSGPIVAHSLWYPGGVNPGAGAVSARLAFATRIGSHLFREFVLERRHPKKTAEQ